MNSLETILNDINSNEYRINPYHLQKMLIETLREGKELKNELNKFVQIDFLNNKEVISFINQNIFYRDVIKGKVVTNPVLDELFAETKHPFLQLLIQYRKSSDKFTKVCSFIKNTIDPVFNKKNNDSIKAFIKKDDFKSITINPNTKINASGGISLSTPSLPFSIMDVKKIFQFNVAISCSSIEEVSAILTKYKDLVVTYIDKKRIDYYIVIGKTLYAHMIIDEFDAFPFESEDYYALIREFQREYISEEESKYLKS